LTPAGALGSTGGPGPALHGAGDSLRGIPTSTRTAIMLRLRLTHALSLAAFLAWLAPQAGAQSSSQSPKPATAKPAERSAKPAAKSAAKSGGKSDAKAGPKPDNDTFSGLSFRSIGPAVSSGRIVDLAVDPRDRSVWYVASAYGGVWKTTNAGTSWTPIFDAQGTSSIGCVTIAPSRSLTVWVGSGENNSQRSVGWGDGVYKSEDGGRSFTNMGLKQSEHIGGIVVHPTNPDIVWVAAQGPLWAGGGDRGVYKTTDGGKTWKQVLKVDEWTGANEVHIDPHDPNVLYASTYQRFRRVWTLIDGGPGSGIWKSTDGGETWTKLTGGLPSGDMGRIGLVVPVTETNVIVATIESRPDDRGTYRSEDGGHKWEKLNGTVSSSPQYYQELFADPTVRGRLYEVDTFLQTSDDGGRTWRRAGEKHKHVDNHVVWVDPEDSRHLLVGCDGGLYESFDRCSTWNFFANLPITQFYKVDVDNDTPFYNVYGGTQDNSTWGGPSRTDNVNGVRNSDWWFVVGGDGFQPRVDPTDPNVAYGESQHGELSRFDRKSGERVDIQPQPEPGEPASHWNWDSPLIVSPHSHTRLYFASQRVYRTDDRGDSWKAVSPDLTRQIDRNRLKVMDRVWSIDAIAKNASTSFYGNIVALDESPLKEGLLFVGTDDGLIQVSEDAGAHWRKVESVPGVGEYAYVSRVVASRFDPKAVYATFDRHKMGDFKPYVYRSNDLGHSWTNITGDLPVGGPVYGFVQDTKDADLLFAGTEFGLFATQNGGKHWFKLSGGLPIQSIRDVTIQRRDDDLVLATFGRGFYILDDLSPLRRVDSEAKLNAEATLLPVRKALLYVQARPMGGEGKAEQGESFYTADNPPFGATFTYYLRASYKSLRDQRREREKDIEKKGGDTFYPPWDSVRSEDREEAPAVLLTVTDRDGNVIRRLTGPTSAGFHRVNWDFRWPDPAPSSLTPRQRGEFEAAGGGPLVPPGTYKVQLAKRINGAMANLGAPQEFECEALHNATLPAEDRAALAAFQEKAAHLQRAVLGTQRVLADAQNSALLLKKALDDTPAASAVPLRVDASRLLDRLRTIDIRLNGDDEIASRNEPTPPSLSDRIGRVVDGSWTSTSAPTASHQRAYEIVSTSLGGVITDLKTALEALRALGDQAEAAGAPWTPGRAPDWKPE
jgi:photosystem II stability/assembly factor-like uncharacterized protein